MDLERVLQWPPETWSPEEAAQVQARRAEVHAELRSLVDKAERFERNLTEEEQAKFEVLQAEFDRLAVALPPAR